MAGTLPNHIWTIIIQQYLLEASLSDCLRLRQVNSWFSEEVLCSLFVLQIRDLRKIVRYKRVPQSIGVLQLQGFFSKRKLTQKPHKSIRKTILRILGHDAKAPNGLEGTCLSYKPHQICPSKIVGSSSNSICRDCDMMNAIVSAFGPLLFTLGSDGNEFDTTATYLKDKRYWLSLLTSYRGDIPQVKYLSQEIIADETMTGGGADSILCDCFTIATRQNNPLLVDVLFEESKECETVLTSLGKQGSVANCLLEAIRLGHCEVFEKLLKWQWKFNHDSWNYSRIVKLVIDEDLFPKKDRATHEKLLRTLFEWTDTWRNISEMKDFLVKVGVNDQQHYLEIAVKALKSQHYFRHERGQEGTFSPSQPLTNLAIHGNLQMVKLFLDNRKILLPHTEPHQDMEMRRAVLAQEFENETPHVDLMKIIMDYSGDLLESRLELQKLLIQNYHLKLHTWAWLAKKVGLQSHCSHLILHTLGSAMLEKAVENLHVEATRFLVNNGVQLVSEANTFQVYEDDEEAMTRLQTVKMLLERGAGQGEYKERRVFETTFTPYARASPTTPKRADTSWKATATARVSTASAPAKAGSSSGTRLLRKSLAVAAKKYDSRKAKKNALTEASGGGEDEDPPGGSSSTPAAT